jgi:oxygen-independent coproporphyrinogen III oxidase
LACKRVWSCTIINSLYVHYPFCLSKCHYCSFYSIPYDPELSKAYQKQLKKELHFYASNYDISKLETIYIGGGRPSLNISDLENIMYNISLKTSIKCIKEYTVECNPVDVNADLLNILKKSGCTRVSLGIQSFTRKAINYCARMGQDDRVIDNALSIMNKSGLDINIDLINGLPRSVIDTEMKNLKIILRKYTNINHISLYDLSIEKGSVFHKNTVVLDESFISKYDKEFLIIISKLGFKRYEVSNYAKNSNRSIHNSNYWKYKNYIGIGPGAHGTIDGLRIENTPDLNSYISSFKKNSMKTILTKLEQIEEYLLMGLRLIEGIDTNDLRKRFNLDIENIIKNSLKRHTKLKNIEVSFGSLKITKKGMDILNTVLVDMFSELEENFKT